MSPSPTQLPHLSDRLFLADGGVETTLIFRDGFDLPLFASFTLLSNAAGYQALERYFRSYIAIAQTYRVGLVLESVTWRANPDWAAKLGHSSADLVEINRQAIALLQDLRQAHATLQTPIVVSGCLGPRGDGYVPAAAMTAEEAAAYHRPQIDSLREAGADLISAMTMNYVEEAQGIAQAARAAGIPAVISFTVETDGHLPTG
ncbi:homocysteine S-methyltransferase, partial [filamentous cyanobacterium CCT1]